MSRMQKGITLRRLIVSVAVIGIFYVFTNVAIVAYSDFTPRSQMSESVKLLSSAKAPIAEYFSGKGRWPSTAEQVLRVTSGQYTDRLDITTGAGARSGTVTVTATMKTTGPSPSISGKTVQISSPDGKSWTCGPGAVNGADSKYLPAQCRD